MKKIIVLLFLFTVLANVSLKALIGKCITKGPETPYSYNYEQWHFVECYHDCPDTMHFCIECGHHHAPKEKQIIITQNRSPEKRITLSLPVTQKNAFTYLTRTIKAAKNSASH